MKQIRVPYYIGASLIASAASLENKDFSTFLVIVGISFIFDVIGTYRENI